MRNRTYGGVRGRKTKVGEKLLRFPPTRLVLESYVSIIIGIHDDLTLSCHVTVKQ